MSANRQIYGVIGMSFLFSGGFTAVSPVLPEVMDAFQVSATHAGLLLSVFAGGRMAFGILGGVVADRLPLGIVVTFASVLVLSGSVAAIVADAFWFLLLARAVQGVGTSVYMVAAMGHIMDLASPERLPRLLAWNQSLLLAGMSVGPALGGFAATVWGYRGPFVLFAAYGVLGLLSVGLLLRGGSRRAVRHGGDAKARRRRRESSDASLGKVLVAPILLTVLGVSLIASTIRSGIRSTVVPLFAADTLAFDAADIGLLLTIAGVANLVVMYPIAKSIEVAGWRRVMAVTTPLCAVPLAALALVENEWQMYVVLSLLAIVSGFSGVVGGAAIAELAPKASRKTVIGIDRTVRDFAFLISPLAATAVAVQFGYSVLFIGLAAAVALLGAVVAHLARPRPSSGGPATVG